VSFRDFEIDFDKKMKDLADTPEEIEVINSKVPY